MAGLIAQGQAYKALTDRGLAEVARADQERDMTNQQIKGAQRQQTIGNTLGAAGLGASLAAGTSFGSSVAGGALAGGPAGALLGAGVALLGGLLG